MILKVGPTDQHVCCSSGQVFHHGQVQWNVYSSGQVIIGKVQWYADSSGQVSSLARLSGMPIAPDRFHHWQVQCDSSGQISSLARFSGMPIFPDRFHHWQGSVECRYFRTGFIIGKAQWNADSSGQFSSLARFSRMPIFPDRRTD